MQANYGYTNANGDYYITFDTDKCDGCGKCVQACPANIIEVAPDDFDELVAKIKDEAVGSLGYQCTGCSGPSQEKVARYVCEKVCEQEAICHSW